MRMCKGFGSGLLQAVTAIALLVATSSIAMAHHSAALYDFTKSVPMTGVVKLMVVENPHTKLILTVTDDKGNNRDITYEGHSRNNVYRRGWRPSMVKEGDKITINFAPPKAGGDGGYIQSFTLQDGRQF